MVPRDANPYQRLLADGIRRLGITVQLCDMPIVEARLGVWPLDADILHIHWTAFMHSAPSLIKAWVKSWVSLSLLRSFKRRGGRVVWTVHNLWPHEMPHPHIDERFRRRLHDACDALIVHSGQTMEECAKTFGSSKRIFVVPHGPYPVSMVPKPRRAEARAYFRIPDDSATVALLLGSARAYKGHDRITKALPWLSQDGVHVVFAGPGHDKQQMAELPGATVLAHVIPDFELPALFAAADVLLLPYRHCTTSGLAILGIGFGTPLVCSSVGPLPDLCAQGLGVVTDPDDPADLADAVKRAQQLRGSAEYAGARAAFLAGLSWDNIARETAAVYRTVVGEK